LLHGTGSASQAAHGNSGASPNAGGGASLAQIAAAIRAHQAQQAAVTNALSGLGAGGVNWLTALPPFVGPGLARLTMGQMLAMEAQRREQATPLEHAGTTFGEIIGWRIWGLAQGCLTSYSADYAWLPRHPTEGDVSDHGYGGIWAFKDANRAFKKALESVGQQCGQSWAVEGWVTGSVWMYGEVVEHQIGYRSQYATVRSIEAVIPNERQPSWRQWSEKREMRKQSKAMLDELRERYGIVQAA